MPSRRIFKSRILAEAGVGVGAIGSLTDQILDLSSGGTVVAATIFPMVDPTGPTGAQTTAADLRDYILGISGGIANIPEPTTFADEVIVNGDFTHNSILTYLAQGTTADARAIVGAGSGAFGAIMTIRATAGQGAGFRFNSGTDLTTGLRWQMYKSGDAESGGNAGSAVLLRAYSDTGTFIDEPIRITRASGGTFAISRPVTMASTLGVTGAATVGGTLGVTGAATLSSNLTVSGYGAVGGSPSSNARWYVQGTIVSTSTTQYGLLADYTVSSSATTDAIGLLGRVQIPNTAMTVGQVSGLYISNMVRGAAATVTAQMGLYIASLSGATTNYAIYTGTGLVRFGDAVTMTSTLSVTGAVTGGTYNGQTISASASFTGTLTVASTVSATQFLPSATVGLRLGTPTTDLTDKGGRIGSRHYTNAEEDIAVVYAYGSLAGSGVYIGGGTSVLNAATEVRIYTAANTTTVTGTIRASWDSAGTFAQVGAATIGGTLGVTGVATFTTTLTQNGTTASLVQSGTTGLINIGSTSSAGDVAVALRTAAGYNRELRFQSAGVNRWLLRINSSAESGSDAGSNLQLIATTDAGATIDSPITINRVTGGLMTITRHLVLQDNAQSSSWIAMLGTGTRSTSAYLGLNAAAGQLRGVGMLSNTVLRWLMYTVNNAESVGDAGSSWALSAYTDAGVAIDSPILVTRAAGGTMALSRPVTMASTLVATGAIRTNAQLSFNVSPVANALIYAASGASVSGNTSLHGMYWSPTFSVDGTSSMSGITILMRSAAGTYTSGYVAGLNVSSMTKGAGHTVSVQYGILINSQTEGTTNYALYTNSGLVRFGDAVSIASGGLTISATGLTITSGGSRTNGYSTSYGVVSSITTIGPSVTMGVAASATWLIAGTSGGTFRAGIQALDAGGVVRHYIGSNYLDLASGTGTTVNLTNVGNVAMSGTLGIAGLQTFTTTNATSIVMNRTSAAANSSIQYQTTGGSVWAGQGAAATFAVGGSADLATSPWLSVSATTLTHTGSVVSLAQSTSSATMHVGSGAGSSSTNILVRSAAAQYAQFIFQTGTVNRWGFYKDIDAESGADAGSTLRLNAWTDAGVYIDNVISITRAAGGTFSITRPLSLTSTLTVTGGTRFNSSLTFSGGASPTNTVLYVPETHALLTSGTSYGLLMAPTIQSTVTSYRAGEFRVVTAAAAFAVSTAMALYLRVPTLGAGSSITTAYGILIEGQTAGVTNYAIYTNGGLVRFGDAVTVASGGIAVTGDSSVTGTLASITRLSVGGTNAFDNHQVSVRGTMTTTTATQAALWMTTTFSASATLAYGIAISNAGNNASHTLSRYDGLQVNQFTKGALQTVTTIRAINIVDHTTAMAVNIYGLYVGAITGGSSVNYAIYTNTGLVRFGDALIIGSTTATVGAIRLPNDNHVSWRNTANTADLPLFVDSADMLRFNGNITTGVSGGYHVNATQVVGVQGAAVADATDAASVIARLNDLLGRLRTHGLIAT